MVKARLTAIAKRENAVESVEKYIQGFKDWEEDELNLEVQPGDDKWIITIEAPVGDIAKMEKGVSRRGGEILDRVTLL